MWAAPSRNTTNFGARCRRALDALRDACLRGHRAFHAVPAARVYMIAGAALGLCLQAGLFVTVRCAATLGMLRALATLAYVGLSLVALSMIGFSLGRRLDRALQASIRDPLTGLFNRRHFKERLGEEMQRPLRFGTRGFLLALDLDHLKRINDQLGHSAGDRALIALAQSIRECVRTTDIAARVGGDEFAVLLPRATAYEAKVVAERIARALAERGSKELPLLVSVGIAEIEATSGTPNEDIWGSADEALHRAKAVGGGPAAIVCSQTCTTEVTTEELTLIEIASAARETEPASGQLAGTSGSPRWSTSRDSRGGVA